MTAAQPFQIRTHPEFHDGRLGAALLVYLTAQAEYPTRAALTANGVLHVHLQTLRRGQRLNDMLLGYLARHLEIPQDDLEIVAGDESAGKVVCVYGLSPAELEARLHRWLHPEDAAAW
ncbi:MAG: hypothetical protein GXO37_01110 [Chloroflexi bacterium]|nr:hypothetical protein [Chloroflexota bacterium]